MPPHSALGAARRARLAAARLYLVCDATPGGRDLREVLRAAIAGGVDIVQLRERRLRDEDLTAVARDAAALCRRLGALFIVNDRPDVALAADADGVHVGQDDMPVARARQLLGAEPLVGLSTHAPAEIDAAAHAEPARERGDPRPDGCDEGTDKRHAAGRAATVDYIGVGPVYATPTKPGRPAVGLELVRYAATHAQLPFYAIGGIDAQSAAGAVAAGARRIAVVRAIAEAPDPERAARELRATLEKSGTVSLEDPGATGA